jgi:hypothetical protein
MKQTSWTRAAIGVCVLIILTVFILNSHQAQATFTATGTSLTGDSNSTIDITGTLGIGNTNTTSIILGQLGQSVTLPGNLILPGITGLTQCLQVNSSGQVSGTGSVCGSGSTSPAGSNTQIQFNNSNAFGASANLTWVSPALTIGNAGSTTGQLALAGATSGSTILQPAAAASGILTLPAATGSIPYYTDSPTSGNCVSWGSSGLLSDAGSACGAGVGSYPGVTTDGANGLDVTGGVSTGVGSGNAGFYSWVQGTAPSSLPSNSFTIYAPSSVSTSFSWIPSASPFTGIPYWTNASNVMTQSQATAANLESLFSPSGSKCYLYSGTGGQGCDTPSAGSGTGFNNGTGTGYQDVTEIANPGNPASDTDRLYLNSTTHLITCLTSSGATCMPSGSASPTRITLMGSFSASISTNQTWYFANYAGTSAVTTGPGTLVPTACTITSVYFALIVAGTLDSTADNLTFTLGTIPSAGGTYTALSDTSTTLPVNVKAANATKATNDSIAAGSLLVGRMVSPSSFGAVPTGVGWNAIAFCQ